MTSSLKNALSAKSKSEQSIRGGFMIKFLRQGFYLSVLQITPTLISKYEKIVGFDFVEKNVIRM